MQSYCHVFAKKIEHLKHQRVSSCVCFTKTTGSKPSCCRLDDWAESKISSRLSSMNESILDFKIYTISFPPRKQYNNLQQLNDQQRAHVNVTVECKQVWVRICVKLGHGGVLVH